jgi:hypothetical protein
MEKKMKYYKVLDMNQNSCNGGDAQWKKGVWMPKIQGKLIPCFNGYHLCRKKDLTHWLDEEIWIAEGRGRKIVDDNKVVFSEARIIEKFDTWNEKTARLFACDCAEHVLKYFEEEYPDDDRVRNCINVARMYANGEVTIRELKLAESAALSAALSAVRSAARSAARSAESAARSAEIKWQTKRLFEYLEGRI